jgi:reactive chlorine resistance protein C
MKRCRAFSYQKGFLMHRFNKLFELAARMDRLGIIVTRIGLVVVLVWIGSLKAFRYEDEGIVPMVANSPLMGFLYRQPAGEYRQHMNREGELVPANREWHERNGTYPFAYGLGSVIVVFGLMIAAHSWLPRVAAVGSFLAFGMSLVTLSFLITTPECWVPALGSSEHGFPLLAGPGRLVIKDAIMAGAALVTMSDSAKAYLRKRTIPAQPIAERSAARASARIS